MAWLRHRKWSLAAELACIALLLLLRASTLPGMHMPSLGGDYPFWASRNDLVLEGPDAGEWAINAWYTHRGQLDQVDVHRMPVWLVLTGGALFFQDDVALAGHLVNHGLGFVLVLAMYGLGRAGGGPAVGLAAGALVALCDPLVIPTRRYGVDAAVSAVLPIALLAALPVRRVPWLAPFAGLVAGFFCLVHYTAIPFVIPAVLLVHWSFSQGYKSALATLGHIAGVVLALWVMSRLFPLPSPEVFMTSVREGMGEAPDGGQDGPINAVKGSTNLPMVLAAMLMPFWPKGVPWGLMSALPWLGVLGAGLAKAPDDEPSKPLALLRTCDLPLGLATLCCLAPMPLLLALDAPPRYATNLLPFLALLIARGFASLVALPEAALRLWRPRWPRGVAAVLPALLLLFTAWGKGAGLRAAPLPPPQRPFAARELGEAMRAQLPGEGGAFSELREAAAQAGRKYCPSTPCPRGTSERDFDGCLAILADECGGEGPIPYVAIVRDTVPLSPEEVAMAQWAMARFGVLSSVSNAEIEAHLVAIPREVAEAAEPAPVSGPAGPAVPPPAVPPPP